MMHPSPPAVLPMDLRASIRLCLPQGPQGNTEEINCCLRCARHLGFLFQAVTKVIGRQLRFS